MTEEFKTIGILSRKHGPIVDQTLTALTEHLQQRGKQVIVSEELAAADTLMGTSSAARLGGDCDLVVVVGGDGTLLDAGRALAPYGTPLLGVNLGRLGFMVDILPDHMATTLDDVFAGHYQFESRLMLAAQIYGADGHTEGEPFRAINECVIRNQAFARVLDFDTYMNGNFVSHHRADGIVVATPTGSTAYALSGGGPVVHPELDALALVPICPHSLADRPLIVDAAQQIEIRVEATNQGAALFTSDGQFTQPLEPGDRVCIKRGPYALKLIHPPGYDYFDILRKKLQWGRGQRLPPH